MKDGGWVQYNNCMMQGSVLASTSVLYCVNFKTSRTVLSAWFSGLLPKDKNATQCGQRYRSLRT